MYHEPFDAIGTSLTHGESRVFSSVAPSSLALPPEMAFQRVTGGMPVHITVHRGLAKQLAHLHAAAIHTPRDASARTFVIAARFSADIARTIKSDSLQVETSERNRSIS